MWPLQDKLKLRDAKDDFCLCFVRAGGQDVKFLNANFSLECQGFAGQDVLAVVPLKHAWQVLTTAKGAAAGKRPALARGSGAMSSPVSSLRKGVLPGAGGAPAAVGGGGAGGAAGEESKGLSAWVSKWTVTAQKTSSKEKTHVTLRKTFLFYSKSEKGPPKGTVPVDLYNVERVSPTQVDLLATGDGWQLAKGVARPQVCLVFDNAALADKWFDELTKRTPRGAALRQFGVPLWYFEARGEVMPQVFLDCVRYIYGRSLQTKELFRQGGDSDDVKFLRGEFNAGQVPALDKIADAHTIAGLLKTWLTELPEPLLTYALFSEFMTAMKLSPEQQIKSLQNSIAKIPKINQRVLWILTQLLKLVHDQGAVNFMHSGNLSVIFAPKIIHPKADINLTYKTQPVFNQITEMLIVQGDQIFSTTLHSTPPDWSFILDPNRAPMQAAAAAPVPVPVAVAIAAVPPPPIAAPVAAVVPVALPPPPPPPTQAGPGPVPAGRGAGGGALKVPAKAGPLHASAPGAFPSAPPSDLPPPPPSISAVPVGAPLPSNLPPPPGAAGLPPPPSVGALPPPPAPAGVAAALPPPPAAKTAVKAAFASPRLSSGGSTPRASGGITVEAALAEIERWRADNEKLRSENDKLKSEVSKLKEELEEKKQILAKFFA